MTVGATARLAERQLELLACMAALDPAPCVFGGFAEDALLAGRVTRTHVDIDWLVPRHELPSRLAQAAELGFESFETWGEAAPGEPFYLSGSNGDLELELGVTDEAGGELVLRVHRLLFDLDGREPPAGYVLTLPADTFSHPAIRLADISIRVASPLALFQIRVGIASQGSFGRLSDRHRATSELLRQRFFPHLSAGALAPRIHPLRADGSRMRRRVSD